MNFRYPALFLIFSAIIAAQPLDLYNGYKIPEYRSHQLTVEANDLLNYYRLNQLSDQSYESNLNIDAGFRDWFELQSKTLSVSFNGSFNYNYYLYKRHSRVYYSSPEEKIFTDEKSENSNFNLNLMGKGSKYFNDPYGIFAYADPGVSYHQSTDAKGCDYSISLNTGAGYGRVINQKSVAQAYLILNALDVNTGSSKVYELAEILDRNNGGYYSANYRDSSAIVFYNDIGRVTGKPSELPKIQQILNSALYKISSRYNGCQAKFGMNSTYYKMDRNSQYYINADRFASDASLQLEYSTPLGMNMQFRGLASVMKNLQDADMRGLKIDLSAEFSVDINYFWTTSVSALVSRAKPLKGDKMLNQVFAIQSNLALFNNAVASFACSYRNEEFSSMFTSGSGTVIEKMNGHPERFYTSLSLKYYLM